MAECNAAKHQGRSPNQLKVWKEFIRLNCLQYPEFCQFLQIMIVTSPNPSPLERSYTKLEIVTEKRRNRITPANLETRYLIAALDIPVKKPDAYRIVRKRLEGSR